MLGVDAINRLPIGWDNKLCAREWRKAVYDVKNERVWTERFGPYLTDQDEDKLAAASNSRATKLPGRNGVNDDPKPNATIERVETRRLAAPRGTTLEVHDVAFCKSGRFQSENWCNDQSLPVIATAVAGFAGGPLAGALAAVTTRLNVLALPGCSNSTELQEAQNHVRSWETWRNGRRAEMEREEARLLGEIQNWNNWAAAKEREAEQYWPIDPRRAAIGLEVNIARGDQLTRELGLQKARAAHATEMAAAEVDYTGRKMIVWAIENKRAAATTHDGICE
jgi:hypothetical protein